MRGVITFKVTTFLKTTRDPVERLLNGGITSYITAEFSDKSYALPQRQESEACPEAQKRWVCVCRS